MANYPSWKKHQIKADGRNLLAVFIFIVLVFAIVNGIARTFSLSKFFSQSTWDSKSPFVSVLKISTPAILIFQKDPKRLALFKLDGNAYLVESGGVLQKTDEIIANETGEKIANILSFNLGADIENFAALDQNNLADFENAKDIFKKFSSFSTPFKIITGTYKKDIKNTNITRIDLLKLWWQAKGVSAEKLEMVDLSPYREEILTDSKAKVLGVNEESVHLILSKYLENRFLDNQAVNIKIINRSGKKAAANLGAEFALSSGFSPEAIEQSADVSEKTQIIAKDKDSYNVSYLASIFDCDIVSVQNEADRSDDIVVVLGRDFASRYFE